MDPSLYVPVAISSFSMMISGFAYFHTVRAKHRELAFQRSSFELGRNVAFEEKLVEWPEAFELYGIDLAEAAKDGVTPQHIAYMILCLDAQSATALSTGTSVLDYITQSRWRQNMYRKDITRKTWKYARHMFEDFTVKDVDEYLARVDSQRT